MRIRKYFCSAEIWSFPGEYRKIQTRQNLVFGYFSGNDKLTMKTSVAGLLGIVSEYFKYRMNLSELINFFPPLNSSENLHFSDKFKGNRS